MPTSISNTLNSLHKTCPLCKITVIGLTAHLRDKHRTTITAVREQQAKADKLAACHNDPFYRKPRAGARFGDPFTPTT